MVEPTETEAKETLDAFAEALRLAVGQAETNPELLREAPITTPVRRLDEAKAARELRLTWSMSPRASSRAAGREVAESEQRAGAEPTA